MKRVIHGVCVCVQGVSEYVKGIQDQSTTVGPPRKRGSVCSQRRNKITHLICVYLCPCEQEGETAAFSHSLEDISRLVDEGGDEPKEDIVRDIDRKLKTWRTANPPSKADADGTKPERRDGKRLKSATKQSEAHDAEMAALAGP